MEYPEVFPKDILEFQDLLPYATVWKPNPRGRAMMLIVGRSNTRKGLNHASKNFRS